MGSDLSCRGPVPERVGDGSETRNCGGADKVIGENGQVGVVGEEDREKWKRGRDSGESLNAGGVSEMRKGKVVGGEKEGLERVREGGFARDRGGLSCDGKQEEWVGELGKCRDSARSAGPVSLASTGIDEGAGRRAQAQVFKEMLWAKMAEYTEKVIEVEQQMVMVADLQAAVKRNTPSEEAMNLSLKDEVKKKGTSVSKGMNPRELRKRNMDCVRQFGIIFKKISKHKWAWPFMQPVDVVSLGLDDYFNVIKKPMDLGTIRDRMKARDGTRYESVRGMCEDVRLVFRNAMTYNHEGSDVHLMAKTLSDIFEEFWKEHLEAETEELEMEVQRQESAAIAMSAVATCDKLTSTVVLQSPDSGKFGGKEDEYAWCERTLQMKELDKQLNDLKQQALSKKRPMSLAEKQRLAHNVQLLPRHKQKRALAIIHSHAPTLSAHAEEVDIDITALLLAWAAKNPHEENTGPFSSD